MTDILLRTKGFYVGPPRSNARAGYIQLVDRGDVMKFFKREDRKIGCEVSFEKGRNMTLKRKPLEWKSLGLDAMSDPPEDNAYSHWFQGELEEGNNPNHRVCVTVYVYEDPEKGIKVYVKPVPYGQVGTRGHENEDGYWDADPN